LKGEWSKQLSRQKAACNECCQKSFPHSSCKQSGTSHDLGMELQYEIESREEVERCFVHIDYESRPYDEHVVSKVPELRERYGLYKQSNSAISI
jgi:hypothetical protein